MRRPVTGILIALLLPLACGPEAEGAARAVETHGSAAVEAAGPAAFDPVVDAKALMLAVVEPAAEVYWDAVGWVIDAAGTHETVPRTTDDWTAVYNAAVLVAESGNLLMMQGRAPDDDEAWTTYSRALIDVGREAMAAAEARDPMAVFDVGGKVYEACTACHAAYALETLRPSDARR